MPGRPTCGSSQNFELVEELLLSAVERTGACAVRHTEMHTAEPFVPDPSASETEFAVWKPKRYKSPGVDQIPPELIQAGEETLHSEIHKLIKLIWNKEELPHRWKGSILIPIHKKGDKTD
jgi:hypothetical protein